MIGMTKWMLKNPILTRNQHFCLIKTPKNQIQSTSLSNSCIDISISTWEKTSSCLFEKLREFHKGKRNIVLKKLYFYNLKSKIHAIHHNVFCLGNKVQTKKKSAKHRGENSSSLTHQQLGKCRVMSILDTPHDFYSLWAEQLSKYNNHRDFFKKGVCSGWYT